MWIAGIDECPGGWVGVLLRLTESRIVDVRIEWNTSVNAFIYHPFHLQTVAIDIPIGLLLTPQRGGRECDRRARRLLRRRASSIFTPPSRTLLHAMTYAEVRKAGMSRQAFGLMAKIREVDAVMTPALQRRVHEAHPELAFVSLAGAPMRYNKKTQQGQTERIAVLQGLGIWPFSELIVVTQRYRPQFSRQDVGNDDLIDAWALAWTAFRIQTGHASRLPSRPSWDQNGLRMEIWF
ncbi:MAG: DUF429 domain-containing protein [Nitrospirae bacterium]|nr:MAG: DUF429 domain-containing protein [Nitrospirota bacterium]